MKTGDAKFAGAAVKGGTAATAQSVRGDRQHHGRRSRVAGSPFVQMLIWATALAGLAIGEAAQPLTLLFSATSISLVVILWHADRSRYRMLEAAIERLTREAHAFASGQDRGPNPARPIREL